MARRKASIDFVAAQKKANEFARAFLAKEENVLPLTGQAFVRKVMGMLVNAWAEGYMARFKEE